MLFAILNYIGLGTSEVVADYLNGILQCMRIANDVSTLRSVTRGGPQGSILGSLLFIRKHLKLSKVHIYANDLPIYLSFYCNNLQQAIRNINSDL